MRADVAELADAHALGACGETLESSSLSVGTNLAVENVKYRMSIQGVFFVTRGT